jgi:hypothetical protein
VIVHYLPDGKRLADREALAGILDRPASTIRARCTPVAYDLETRRALYDADEVTKIMDGRQRRRFHPQTRTA